MKVFGCKYNNAPRSFQLVTGHLRNRAAKYDEAVGAVKANTRIVFGLTTEASLAALSQNANQQRLRGEEVRLIEVPAVAEGEIDIFDGPEADEYIGRSVKARQKRVHEIERVCEENQGVAHRVFLESLVDDAAATAKLQGWMTEFTEVARDLQTDPARGRIIASFAVVYAAARLAISYDVLPWGAKSTRRALLDCLRRALEHLSSVEARERDNTAVPSAQRLVSEFVDRVRRAKIAMKGSTARELRAADAIMMKAAEDNRGAMILLKADRLREWYPYRAARNILVQSLNHSGISLPGRDATTSTVQKQISALGNRRLTYYPLLIDMARSEKDHHLTRRMTGCPGRGFSQPRC